MYESPLTVVESIASQITKQEEDRAFYEIKQAVGYDIDKQEFIKALQYDRNQYQKGYADAMAVLEEIKADIDAKQYSYMADKDYDEGIRFGLMLAYQIVDKHINGKEQS